MGDLGWEDSLEKGKATHSSVLAWRIPWTIVHGVTKSQTQLSDFHFNSLRRGSSLDIDTAMPQEGLPWWLRG